MTSETLYRRAAGLVFLIAALSADSLTLAQQPHPLSGKWKANLEKSQRHPNHQFESLTLTLEISTGDTVRVIYSGVNMSGKDEGGTRTLHADGKEYPVSEAAGIVEVTRWVGTNSLETVARKDGQIVGESTYEVSADRKTMTAKVKGIDANGRPFEQTIVFDRL